MITNPATGVATPVGPWLRRARARAAGRPCGASPRSWTPPHRGVEDSAPAARHTRLRPPVPRPSPLTATRLTTRMRRPTGRVGLFAL